MGLRTQAATDLRAIVEDVDGFGWPITVTNPAGTVKALTGLSTDIGHAIDMQTGLAVSGRTASVALALASLGAAGLDIPRGVASKASKPWLVTFNDIGGSAHTFKVSSSRPDRALGIVTLMLEAYVP